MSVSEGKKASAILSDDRKNVFRVLALTLWLVIPPPTEHFSPTRRTILLVRVLNPVGEGVLTSVTHTSQVLFFASWWPLSQRVSHAGLPQQKYALELKAPRKLSRWWVPSCLVCRSPIVGLRIRCSEIFNMTRWRIQNIFAM